MLNARGIKFWHDIHSPFKLTINKNFRTGYHLFGAIGDEFGG